MTELAFTEEKLQQMLAAASEQGAQNALKSMPAKDTAGVSVTIDEGDRPFKSLADMVRAVKNAAIIAETGSRQRIDARLQKLSDLEDAAIKTGPTGANESIPNDGGFLVDPTISQDLILPMHNEGPFSSKVRRLPVASNSNYGWINGVDETSRATGSRWGGVQGYRLNEGGTKLASRPKFRRINWELKKFAVLMYATDELLMDAAQFNVIAKESAGEELNFMVNDDIYAGIGTGGPQGMMVSGALVSVARQDLCSVAHADIISMWQHLLPSSRANAEWFINSEVQPYLDQLYFTGTTSVLSPYVGYRPDGVMTLYGRPVNTTEFNKGLGVAGDVLLADMSEYLFWEKGDVQAATSIHVAFLTDEQAFRFVYRCDGKTTYSSAITPYQSSQSLTQSSFVSLKAATS